jgi:hypothetical protein
MRSAPLLGLEHGQHPRGDEEAARRCSPSERDRQEAEEARRPLSAVPVARMAPTTITEEMALVHAHQRRVQAGVTFQTTK